MKNKNFFFVSILLSILFFSSALFGQKKDSAYCFNKNYCWANIHSGIGSTGYPILLTAGFGGTYMRNNKHVIEFNYTYLQNVLQTAKNVHELNNFVLSYGMNKSVGRINSFILSLGISYTNGIYFGNDTSTAYNNIWFLPVHIPKYIQLPFQDFGFYISGQYLLRTRFYGFGIKAYCKIYKYTDYGIELSHNIGVLNSQRR